ncbi:MAG: tetratricopeptide repeat protein [Nitrososphaeraceae archaeon]
MRDDDICNTMAVILYNLGKIEEAKYYYEQSLEINPILTKLLTERGIMVFNKRINSNTKQ